MTIFIFGFGQVSKELAERLSNVKNINFKIVSRNTENFLNYAFLKINFFKENKLNFSDSILISTIPPFINIGLSKWRGKRINKP